MDGERNQQQCSEMTFEQRLLSELQQLVRPRHARWDELGLLAVRSFIREQLEACGPVELHTFEEGPDAGVNLILKLDGQNPELEPILVAAHYDGPLNSPGADDNGTGVAALLELARRWSAIPPQRPLWLVAFDKEEWGMLGSKALAQDLRQQQQSLHLMLSLEMLGYTSEEQMYPQEEMRELFGDRGDFIALVANNEAAHLLPGLSREMNAHVNTKVLPVPHRGEQMPSVRLSDHSPFWDAGYNAMMVTDTSFMRNPHYHEPTDTIETLDLPFLMAVIDGLEVAIGRLG
jgi:Zn-dependent M28 family amino/carboxypeptidase